MFFRKKYKIYTIGNIELKVQLPQYSKKSSLPTVDALPLFDIVWPSSEILCQVLKDRFFERASLEGVKILEVGCGMALVSLYLNARGADVTAMDIHPMAATSLLANVRLNKSKALPFVNASWSEDLAELGEFDLIIGSDILYEPQHILALPGFLKQHLKQDGDVIIVDPDRGRTTSFRSQMSDRGFVCQVTRSELSDSAKTPYRGSVDHYHF